HRVFLRGDCPPCLQENSVLLLRGNIITHTHVHTLSLSLSLSHTHTHTHAHTHPLVIVIISVLVPGRQLVQIWLCNLPLIGCCLCSISSSGALSGWRRILRP